MSSDEPTPNLTIDDIALDGLIALIESTIAREAISRNEFARRAGLSANRLRDLLDNRVPLSRADKKASLGLALDIGADGVDKYLAEFNILGQPSAPVDTIALQIAIDNVVSAVETLKRVAAGQPPAEPAGSSPAAQPPEEAEQ